MQRLGQYSSFSLCRSGDAQQGGDRRGDVDVSCPYRTRASTYSTTSEEQHGFEFARAPVEAARAVRVRDGE